MGVYLSSLKGPGAVEILLEIPRVIRRQDDGVVIVGGKVIGEIAVGRIEMEFDRLVVDLLGRSLGEHAREGRERVGGILRIGQAVDGRHHVVGRHGLAVVELDSLAQLEGPDGAVLVGLPALRQHRLQPKVGAGIGQELAGLLQHEEAAAIGHRDRIDGRRRNRGGDPDRRTGRGGSRRGRDDSDAEGAEDRAHQRQGHADHAAVAQKGAAIDKAGGELVDDVILELAAPAADAVDQLVVALHGEVSLFGPPRLACRTRRASGQ